MVPNSAAKACISSSCVVEDMGIDLGGKNQPSENHAFRNEIADLRRRLSYLSQNRTNDKRSL
jgi:hypothetical protein